MERAMHGGKVSPAAAAAFLEAKAARRRESNFQLYERACADREQIIAHIVATYKPQRVYVWGSLLRPERFNEMSDIDIAVEGITTAERWFALYGDAMEMTAFRVDIVQLEDLEPEYRAYIVEQGRLVYECDG